MAQRPRKGPRVPFGHSLQTKFMLSYGAIILALVLFLFKVCHGSEPPFLRIPPA